MSKNRSLPTNLLHFGYNPTDPFDARSVALKNSTEYYSFQTVIKKLEQLEKILATNWPVIKIMSMT